MALDLNALQADAAEQEAHQKEKVSLEDLVSLGEKLEELLTEQAVLELNLKNLNDVINQLHTRSIPDALISLGLKDFTLSDGTVVERAEIVTAGITDATRVEAHHWLRANGFGDLIKNEVLVTFGKGEDEYATKILEDLRERQRAGELRCGSIEQKERVHPQTLNAQVRGWLQQGRPFPIETFKVFIGQTAKLKRPKESKV